MKMKSIYKYACALSMVGVMSSCSDFLERSAQNLIVPESATHYTELLQGEGYFRTIFEQTKWLMLMTDDVEYQECYSRYSKYVYTSTSVECWGDAYSYQQNIENPNFSDGAFLYLYHQISVANLCLDGLNNGVSGTDEEKETLYGQAYFTRAMAYFYLANIYSQAYNESKPDDLCVPLVLTGDLKTGSSTRATISEVWGQMVEDINLAMTNLQDKKFSDNYKISYKAALVLAERIYLFMENYDKAIECGEKLLALQSDLCDISGQTMAVKKNTFASEETVINFLTTTNPEIIWNFNDTPTFGASGYTYYGLLKPYGSGYPGYWFGPSSQSTYADQKNLMDMYDANATTLTGDRRKLYWFIQPSKKTSSTYAGNYISYQSLKYDRDDKVMTMLLQCFRTGEVYVSLAEAYARRNGAGDTEKSIHYLNALREKRINPYTALTSADFATNNDLVQFCWDERRRELCFEECHRWWDMRREGQKPVHHRYNQQGVSGNAFVTYSLKEKDPAFIMDFPKAERDLSPSLVPNSRPQRLED